MASCTSLAVRLVDQGAGRALLPHDVSQSCLLLLAGIVPLPSTHPAYLEVFLIVKESAERALPLLQRMANLISLF